MEEVKQPTQGQITTVYVQQKKSNGLGVAGFVLSLCAILFCWLPVINLIVWLLGLIFSACGIFKTPKGLAIAGLVISLIGIIVMMTIFGTLFAAFG